MPWCPKCKTEYREGFKVCADCGSALVAEKPSEDSKQSGKLRWEQLEAYAQQEAATAVVNSEIPEEIPENVPRQKRASGIYQNSSERASENRSSAWVLLVLGILGLAAVILGALGILPINMGNSYLFYGVMGAVFVLFIVGGVVSVKNAKFFEKRAESENSLRSTLLDWCKDNLNAAEIDARVGAQGLSEEILYFRRFAYIKERMNYQFVNLDQSFLERLIDENIYDSVFEEKVE